MARTYRRDSRGRFAGGGGGGRGKKALENKNYSTTAWRRTTTERRSNAEHRQLAGKAKNLAALHQSDVQQASRRTRKITSPAKQREYMRKAQRSRRAVADANQARRTFARAGAASRASSNVGSSASRRAALRPKDRSAGGSGAATRVKAQAWKGLVKAELGRGRTSRQGRIADRRGLPSDRGALPGAVARAGLKRVNEQRSAVRDMQRTQRILARRASRRGGAG